MASAIKSKVAGLAGVSSSSSATSQEAEEYKLLVTAGPSYHQSQHKIINVNTGDATYVENEYLRAKINVRVKGFRGLPSTSPSSSDYFDHPLHDKDQYSLGFSFVPKQDLPSLDTVWGNDLDHPVRDRVPPGFNTAFRIVKEFIDPGLACDVYADEPWLYGPSLSCWFALRIGDEYAEDVDFPAPGVLTEGADGSGNAVREQLGLPENNEKRRKYFLSAENRKEFVFKKGRLYQGDFYNPYLDFANFALKLPGFSLKVIKYIGEKTHHLRYVFKNRETGEVYFNVNFTLLWGEKLRQAMREDEKPDVDNDAGNLNGIVAEHVSYGAESHVSSSHNSKAETIPDETSEQPSNEPRPAFVDGSSISSAPASMQIHPGDHYAAADARVTESTSDGVDEIDRLLRATSTKQKREGPLLYEEVRSRGNEVVAKRNDTTGGNALLYRMMKPEWKRDIDELANQFDQDSRARGEPSALEKLSKMQAEIKAGQLEVKNLSSSQEDLLRIALEAQALPMPSPVEPLNNPDAGLNRAAEAIPEAEEREEKQPDQHPGDEVESSSKVADLLASLPKSKEEAPDMDLEHLSVEQKDLLIAAFEAQARPMPTVATKSSPAMGNSSGTAPAASVEDVEDEDRLGGA